MSQLDREEYVEQAYFFARLGQRVSDNAPLQDVLEAVKEEILATTKLPLAIGYMLAELRHAGIMGDAMRRLGHYFAPFQTYLISAAENEGGRFDMRLALEILRREAAFRAEGREPQALFVYQFETLCRNRLSYDRGLAAVADDPWYDTAWREWILTVRRQVGLVDFADMLYVRSEYFRQELVRRGSKELPTEPALFGAKEGRIARANRRKDPLYLFGALQRQLGYPEVPRYRPTDRADELLGQLARRMERMETRIKLFEEEQRGGIDITKFYSPPADFQFPQDDES